MVRKIVHIEEEKCNGCGACANACHEGAIAMVNGKARLLRDDYCDGLGDCLPACPTGAITIIEREAEAYDEAAVQAKQGKAAAQPHAAPGCPGLRMRQLRRTPPPAEASRPGTMPSQLAQWPCQIKLAPIRAPYFEGAKLLIAAGGGVRRSWRIRTPGQPGAAWGWAAALPCLAWTAASS